MYTATADPLWDVRRARIFRVNCCTSSANALLACRSGADMADQQIVAMSAAADSSTRSLDPSLYRSLVLASRFKTTKAQDPSLVALAPYLQRVGIQHVVGIHRTSDQFRNMLGRYPQKVDLPNKITHPKQGVTLDPDHPDVTTTMLQTSEMIMKTFQRAAKLNPKGKAKEVICGDVFLLLELRSSTRGIKPETRCLHMCDALDASGVRKPDQLMDMCKTIGDVSNAGRGGGRVCERDRDRGCGRGCECGHDRGRDSDRGLNRDRDRDRDRGRSVTVTAPRP